MYTLEISANGTWYQLDLVDQPAMTYQFADIAELKDLRATYSQNLKLPMTKGNIKAFAFANEACVDSTIQYQQIPCKLRLNDILIVSSTAFLILLNTDEYFNCQILSGNADFFEVLKSKKMSELDLGTFTLVSDFVNNNPNIRYGASYQSDPISFDTKKILPFAYTQNIIEKIIQDTGYTLLYDLSIDNEAISLGDVPVSETTFDAFKTIAKATGRKGDTFYLDTKIVKDEAQWTEIVQEGFYIKPTFDGTFRIRTRCKSNVNTTNPYLADMWIRNMTQGVNLAFWPLWTTIVAGEVKEEYSLPLPFKAGETIRFYAYGVSQAENFVVDIDIFDIQTEAQQVPVGGVAKVSDCITYDTQLDFVKMFVQAHGLFTYVDHGKKEVYMYSFDDILSNKSKAVNWSNRAIYDKPKLDFVPKGYAQSNVLKFEDNNGLVDSYAITLPNNTLDLTKDFMSIKLKSVGTKPLTGTWALLAGHETQEIEMSVPVLNNQIYDADGNFAKSQSCLCRFYWSYVYKGLDGNLPPFTRVDPVSAKDLCDSYYKWLQTIFSKSKVIEDSFIKPYIPVYIEKYGACFYVNKISNFISGKPTKCELIKI